VALRNFRDQAGTEWRVWNVEPTSFVAASIVGQPVDEERPRWLCFESREEKRRLIPAPDGWDATTDAELDDLRRSAEVVARTVGHAVEIW